LFPWWTVPNGEEDCKNTNHQLDIPEGVLSPRRKGKRDKFKSKFEFKFGKEKEIQ